VADISAIVTPSSSKVGTNVATTVTITGTELVASDDKVRLGNGDCTDGNLLAGTDDTALASPTTFTFTPTAALNNAKVCLKVKDDNRSDETYVDTGVTLTVSTGALTAIAGSRVAKGQAITFVLSGHGLDTHMKVKVIASSATCSGADDTGDVITGGDGKAITSTSTAKTGASVAFTLTQFDADAINAKFCLLTAPAQGGAGTYADSGERVSVVHISSITPAQVGLYVNTEMTIAGNALTTGGSGDKVRFGTSDCNTAVTNVDDVQLQSGTAFDVEARAAQANAKVCLLVADAERSPTYMDTGLTVNTAASTISGVDVDKVVRGDTITYTLSGYGLESHVKMKILDPGQTCGGTTDAADIVAGGTGKAVTSTNNAKTSASASFTMTASAASAKICVLVPSSNYGGSGAYADTSGSDTVTIADVTSSSPAIIGLYVATQLTIAGNSLTTNDQIAIADSGQSCESGTKVTNVNDVALASGTAVTITAQEACTNCAICLKVDGSSVYHETGLTITVAVPAVTAVDVNKVARDDSVLFTFTGYGLGTHVKCKVVTSGTGCSGTADTSTISGGAAQQLAVSSPGELTTATLTFQLATAHSNARICFFVPSSNYGGSGAYAGSTTVTIADVVSTTPSKAGTNIQFYLYLDSSLGITTSDMIKIATDCAGNDAANVIAGGDGVVVQNTDGLRRQFQITAAAAAAKICLKVAGSSDYHDTTQRITIEKPSITSISPAVVAGTVATTITINGYGLDSNIMVKFVSTDCSGDDNNDKLTGGGGYAIGNGNARTTSGSDSKTLRTAITAGKVCVKIPSASGGTDAYEDTGHTIQVQGTGRYLVISTAGYGFLAGASPTAATTPFVVKICKYNSASYVISTDEEHGVTQVVAAVSAYPGTNNKPAGGDATMTGTTTQTISIGTNNGVITWTDLKFDFWGGKYNGNSISDGFQITFTATTLSGTTMTSTAVVSSRFVVGGIAKSLQLFTAPAGCLAGIACTTQPVVKVLDAGGSVLDDRYSGIQTIDTTVATNTGCEDATSPYSNTAAVSAGASCTVGSGVCTYSGQIVNTWANALVLRYTAVLPTQKSSNQHHTMTSNVEYVDTSPFTVKGTADKIALTWDATTWVATFPAYSSSVGEPSLTAPRVQVQDGSNSGLSDACVHGVTQVRTVATETCRVIPWIRLLLLLLLLLLLFVCFYILVGKG
jgi:hypothetical protein